MHDPSAAHHVEVNHTSHARHILRTLAHQNIIDIPSRIPWHPVQAVRIPLIPTSADSSKIHLRRRSRLVGVPNLRRAVFGQDLNVRLLLVTLVRERPRTRPRRTAHARPEADRGVKNVLAHGLDLARGDAVCVAVGSEGEVADERVVAVCA